MVAQSLTAQQESELLAGENGVAVLFGSALSGLDRVIDFLRETCEQSLLRIPEGVTDFRTFQARAPRHQGRWSGRRVPFGVRARMWLEGEVGRECG